MTRRIVTVLCAVLLLGALTTSPVLAGCDPGRANVAGSYLYGRYMGVSGDTRFRGLEATMDNTAIPYREGGTATRTLLELLNPSTGHKLYAGLRWSPGQGSLGSTQVMVHMFKPGGVNETWYSDPVSEITNSPNYITVRIEKADFIIDENEMYTLWIDGIQRYQTFTPNGPQGFTQARVFSHIANNGSQVPGGSSDPQTFSLIRYWSQYGDATWGGTGGSIQSDGKGIVAHGGGWLSTRDFACIIP